MRKPKFDIGGLYTFFDEKIIQRKYMGFDRSLPYVALKAGAARQVDASAAAEAPSELQAKVSAWLGKPNLHSLLVVGDSGSGKSHYSLRLAMDLWRKFHVGASEVPIWFNLASYARLDQDPYHHLLQNVLQDGYGMKPSDIEMFQQACKEGFIRLVLLIDGGDEGPEISNNLYKSNGWADWGVAKVVMFTRPSMLSSLPLPYKKYFTMHGQEALSNVKELWVRPFSSEDVDTYLAKYIDYLTEQDALVEGWQTAAKYQNELKKIPTLMAMVTNPFVLTMVVQCLPSIVKKSEDDPHGLQTRQQIYKAFIDAHFSAMAEQRVWKNAENQLEIRSVGIRTPADLKACLHIYAERISKLMWVRGQGKLELVLNDDETLIDNLFYGMGSMTLTPKAKTIIREHCLFESWGGVWHPRHKSIVEFFVSEALFTSVYLIIDQQFVGQALEKEISLNSFSLQSEPDIIGLLIDRVHTVRGFRESLLATIDASRTLKKIEVAAANALSVLVAAGINLSDKDFSGVSVPRANLTGMIADGVQFPLANLTGCQLSGAWLARANFTDAIMYDVDLGLKQSIEHDKLRSFTAMAMDCDSGLLYTGDSKGRVDVWNYESTTRAKQHWEGAIGDRYESYRKKMSYPPIHVMRLSHDKQTLAYATATRVWLRRLDNGGLQFVDVLAEKAEYGLYDFSLLPAHPDYILITLHGMGSAGLYRIEDNHYDYFIPISQAFALSSNGQNIVCLGTVRENSITEQRVVLYAAKDLVTSEYAEPVASFAIDELKRNPIHYAFRFSPSNRYLLVVAKQNHLFDMHQQVYLKKFGVEKVYAPKSYVTFFPDESCVLISENGKHIIWHIETASVHRVFPTHHISYEIYNKAMFAQPCIDAQNVIYYLSTGSIEARPASLVPHYQNVLPGEIVSEELVGEPTRFVSIVIADKVLKGPDDLLVYFYMPGEGRHKGIIPMSHLFGDDCPSLVNKTVQLQLIMQNLQDQTKQVVEVPWLCKSIYEDERFSNFMPLQQRPHTIRLLDNRLYTVAVSVVLLSQIFEACSMMKYQSLIDEMRKYKQDNRVSIFDFKSGGRISVINPGHVYGNMFFSADDTLLFTYGDGLNIWNVDTGEKVVNYDIGCYITAAALSADMRWLAMCGVDRSFHICEVGTSKRYALVNNLLRIIGSIQFHISNRCVVLRERANRSIKPYVAYEIVEATESESSVHLRLLCRTAASRFCCESALVDRAYMNSATTAGLFAKGGATGDAADNGTTLFSGSELSQEVLCEDPIVDIDQPSVIHEEWPITFDSWVVTLARHIQCDYPEHAFIILEGMDALGKQLAVRFDLTTIERGRGMKSGLARVNINLKYPIEAANYEEAVLRLLRSKGIRHINNELRGYSWMIEREEGIALFNSMVNERAKDGIPYSVGGAAAFWSKGRHNCYSFAREQLLKMGNALIERDLPLEAGAFLAMVTSASLNQPIY